MRPLLIAAFVLFVSFGTPSLANAQVCTSAGAACTPCTGTTCICQDTGDGFSCQPPTGTVPANTNPGGNQSANTNPSSNTTLINPLNSGNCTPNGDCLMSFLNKILEFVIRIGTVVVILMLVYVGFKFVAAQGNDTKISEARTMLLWTVVGALILLGSQAIAIGIKATVSALSTGG